jgi:hypothetical protein
MEDGPMRVAPGAPDTTHMPVINANSSSPRRTSFAPVVDAQNDVDVNVANRIVQANERHSALWRTFVGASVAGVAALGIHSTMAPAVAQPPAPVMNQAAPPNVSTVTIPAPGASYDKPIVVVVPPSVRPAPAPSQTTSPPAHVTPAPVQAPAQRATPPAHAAPAPVQTTSPAPVQQGVFGFAPLPAGARLGVNGTFTTTIVFGPTAIPFAGNAQVLKSDANNLTLRINATGTSGIARGQSRTAQLSFSKIDAKHVRFTAQDLTGQSTTTSTLTVVASSPSRTQLRAADGSLVTLTDAKGTLTIAYDQNVIRVAHPVTTVGDS